MLFLEKSVADSEMIRGWMEILVGKTWEYMNNGYSLKQGKLEAWWSSYAGILDDSNKCFFSINELEHTFFNLSVNFIKEYYHHYKI